METSQSLHQLGHNFGRVVVVWSCLSVWHSEFVAWGVYVVYKWKVISDSRIFMKSCLLYKSNVESIFFYLKQRYNDSSEETVIKFFLPKEEVKWRTTTVRTDFCKFSLL